LVLVLVLVVLMFLSFVPFQMLKSTRQHSREINFYFVRNLANGATNAPPIKPPRCPAILMPGRSETPNPASRAIQSKAIVQDPNGKIISEPVSVRAAHLRLTRLAA
jgi:hypothetical protein